MKKKEERLIDGWKLVTDSGCGLLVPEDADIDHEVVNISHNTFRWICDDLEV